jgi:hypothetical protein
MFQRVARDLVAGLDSDDPVEGAMAYQVVCLLVNDPDRWQENGRYRTEAFVAELQRRLKDAYKTHRFWTAQQLVTMLLHGRPSDQHDAEQIIGALGTGRPTDDVSPDEIRRVAYEEGMHTAVQLLAKRLKS